MTSIDIEGLDVSANFPDVLEQAFAANKNAVCLRFGSETFSYHDVDKLSKKVAARLQNYGCRKGSHIAIYSENSAMVIVIAIAISRIGAIWIPINHFNSPENNLDILTSYGCDTLLFSRQFSDQALSVYRQLSVKPSSKVDETGPVRQLKNRLNTAVSIEDTLTADLNAMTEDEFTKPEIDPRDILSLPQTGGTTGSPKGIQLSHRNFCALALGSDLFFEDQQAPRVLYAAPLTHTSGRQALAAIACRHPVELVILDKVDIIKILEAIETHKITTLFLPPTAIYRLLDHPQLREFDLSSLTCLIYASAPMLVDRIKQAIDTLGPVLCSGYAQTECPLFITEMKQTEFLNGEGFASDKRLSSIGRKTKLVDVAILDEKANSLEANTVGEIAVKGPNVFEGYFNNPEETEAVSKNGWHLTGDIGYQDEDGFFYIVDRKKDMIITGGFNVYSLEVENIIAATEGVSSVAVVGLPDHQWGEMVTAFVQLEEGTSISEEDLITICKSKLGSVKSPKQVFFVTQLPMTAYGKIDKKALKTTPQEKLLASGY